MSDLSELARKYYAAFAAKDRGFMEANLADGFTFTSPYDDHIDRATYFERCWPNSGGVQEIPVLSAVANGDEVFVLYEFKTATGPTYRNVERMTFEGGKLKSVEVYFGDPPSGVAKEDYAAFLEVAKPAWAAKTQA
jgi:hypothetical protein